MNEGDSEKIAHLHQADYDKLSEELVDLVLELIEEHKKFTPRDVLFAVYGACLAAGDKISVFAYKEFLEDVDEVHQTCLQNAREGFAIAKKRIAEGQGD